MGLICYTNYDMKISIEYAHIYTNDHINEEHQLSVDVLKEVVENIEQEKNQHSLVVMVDDYSFPDPNFNYDSFLEWLNTQGFAPNLLLRESQLIPICDDVLSLMPDGKLKGSIVDYIKAKNKYPCSLFIAAWYLLRLGGLESDIFPKILQSNSLINILPESFKPFEEKGIKIIESAGFGHFVKNIHYKFLEGRIIA